MLFKHQLCRV